MVLGIQCQPQQLPQLRELKEHWDLTDISENWAWHPLQELILMETLKEVMWQLFYVVPQVKIYLGAWESSGSCK